MKRFVRFATGFLFAWCFIVSAAPQGNSFTYQGRLTDGTLPAYGNGGGWTNIPFTAITGGLNTNILVLGLGNVTNTLVFSNGVLIRVQ